MEEKKSTILEFTGFNAEVFIEENEMNEDEITVQVEFGDGYQTNLQNDYKFTQINATEFDRHLSETAATMHDEAEMLDIVWEDREVFLFIIPHEMGVDNPIEFVCNVINKAIKG